MSKIKINLTKQDLDKPIENMNNNKLINISLKEDKELLEISKSSDMQIKEIITNSTIHIVSSLLKDISNEYNLDLTELKNTYLNKFNESGLYTLLINKLLLLDNSEHLKLMDLTNKEKGINKIDYTKCFGKTATGSQCTRKKKDDSNFCGGHIFNIPHGRIDIDDKAEVKNNENETEVLIKQVKKRGRPKRVKEEDKYALIEISDKNYIISLETNKFYEYPENSTTFNIKTAIPVGEKEDDEFIFY